MTCEVRRASAVANDSSPPGGAPPAAVPRGSSARRSTACDRSYCTRCTAFQPSLPPNRNPTFMIVYRPTTTPADRSRGLRRSPRSTAAAGATTASTMRPTAAGRIMDATLYAMSRRLPASTHGQ